MAPTASGADGEESLADGRYDAQFHHHSGPGRQDELDQLHTGGEDALDEEYEQLCSRVHADDVGDYIRNGLQGSAIGIIGGVAMYGVAWLLWLALR